MNFAPVPPEPDELTHAKWFKASRSDSANGCVEVAHVDEDWTAIRDSKTPRGPVHLFTRLEWACFLDGAKRGEFDRD